MKPAYLSDHQVAARYSVTRLTVWRWSGGNGGFPQPIKIGPSCTRWRFEDLLRWEEKEKPSRSLVWDPVEKRTVAAEESPHSTS